jgi:hypothetical protein
VTLRDKSRTKRRRDSTSCVLMYSAGTLRRHGRVLKPV